MSIPVKVLQPIELKISGNKSIYNEHFILKSCHSLQKIKGQEK